MICGAPFCGQEIRFDAELTPEGARIRVLSPRSRTTPRAVSVHELWTCQRPACRAWAALRTEELDGGRPWLEHMTHVVMTQYCPALPAHLRPPRTAPSPDERAGATAAIEHRREAAASGSGA